MQVRFFAYIRNFTGCAEADIPYRENIGDLACFLCDRYGDKLRQKIFPDNSPDEKSHPVTPGVPAKFGPEIIILINGRHVDHLGGTAAPLKNDDRVDIFPTVAGG